MIGYFGHLRSTEVEVEILNPVEAAITGAGKITCPECGGDGDWSTFLPEPSNEPCPCVVCKGTGLTYISV